MTQQNPPFQTQFQIITFPFPIENPSESWWGRLNDNNEWMQVSENKNSIKYAMTFVESGLHPFRSRK